MSAIIIRQVVKPCSESNGAKDVNVDHQSLDVGECVTNIHSDLVRFHRPFHTAPKLCYWTFHDPDRVCHFESRESRFAVEAR